MKDNRTTFRFWTFKWEGPGGEWVEANYHPIALSPDEFADYKKHQEDWLRTNDLEMGPTKPNYAPYEPTDNEVWDELLCNLQDYRDSV